MEAAVAAVGAMAYVNTVVLVQAKLGLGEETVALAFAAFGSGSMLAAFILPRILARVPDRPVMIGGAVLMVVGVVGVPLVGNLPSSLVLWAVIGFSLTQTPIGRLIHRSAREVERGAAFAAQFALSHACWLVTYPLARWIGALSLAAILAHDHSDLQRDHSHLREHEAAHAHPLLIDDLHRRWPRSA